MILSKNLKKVLLVGASVLMFASVGAGSSQVMNANAKRRPARVHRVVRRHSRKALRRYAHLKRAHAWNKKRNAHLKRVHALNTKRNAHKRNVHKYNVAKAKYLAKAKKVAKSKRAPKKINAVYVLNGKLPKNYNQAIYNRGWHEGFNTEAIQFNENLNYRQKSLQHKIEYTAHLGNNPFYKKGWFNGFGANELKGDPGCPRHDLKGDAGAFYDIYNKPTKSQRLQAWFTYYVGSPYDPSDPLGSNKQYNPDKPVQYSLVDTQAKVAQFHKDFNNLEKNSIAK